ncbi:MAG: cyanophycinase [Balneolaceae bacterium]
MKYTSAIFTALLVLGSGFTFTSCTDSESSSITAIKGSLLIIGGGSRPDSMIDRMITETGIHGEGYAIVLTMSGFDPDTSGYYAERQFREKDISNIRSYDFGRSDSLTQTGLDSLENASLVYITGGVQSRFMDAVNNHPLIAETLKKAYQRGAMISGTSAGAAVMSKIMITGDQHNYPEYTSTFYNLEKDNIITAEGLGLIQGVIVDQHFVKRARNNRLLTAVMEFPDHVGIGIDESTAILVKQNQAEVIGDSQVLVYRNLSGASNNHNLKLGAQNLQLNIYLPGDFFKL